MAFSIGRISLVFSTVLQPLRDYGPDFKPVHAKTTESITKMYRFLDFRTSAIRNVPVDIKKVNRPGVSIIEMNGKFDIEQAENFENNFNKLIADRPKTVGLDLNNVNYIDSSAIGSIIKSLNTVKNYGGEMILFGLKPMILNVFKLAKLDNFFKILTAEEFNAKYPGG